MKIPQAALEYSEEMLTMCSPSRQKEERRKGARRRRMLVERIRAKGREVIRVEKEEVSCLPLVVSS